MPAVARRHQLEGSLIYHIINRGNRRDDIFHNPEDHRYFMKLLKGYSDRFQASIYHWVIMPNHYHILLEVKDPENLSRMMAGLARSYVYHYQRSYNLPGHIWQGRFKSQPIEKENYLLACGRYIERNPLKAKIINSPEDYEYSSAGFYTNGKPDGLTKESPFFETFGRDESERRRNYAEFLKTFDHEEEALFSKEDDLPIGSEQFKSRLLYAQGRYLPMRKGKARGYAALSV